MGWINVTIHVKMWLTSWDIGGTQKMCTITIIIIVNIINVSVYTE